MEKYNFSSHAGVLSVPGLRFVSNLFLEQDISGGVVLPDNALRILQAMNAIKKQFPLSRVEMFGEREKIAIIVNLGINLLGSVECAAQLWNDDSQKKFPTYSHMLITGYRGEKRVKDTFDPHTLVASYCLSHPENILHQGFTFHTGTQALWVAEKMRELRCTMAILVCPTFHMPRKWATILEAMRRYYKEDDFAKCPIVPIPLNEEPFKPDLLIASLEENGEKESDDPYANRGLTSFQAALGEHARMNSYSTVKENGTPGDVMSPERVEAYVEWCSSLM